MLTPSLPCSLADLLKALGPCFTAPTFRTFQALVGGFLAQPGLRTVTGMLVGAGLAGRRHHARAHRFFAVARWQADQLGLAVCGLIVARLLDADAPIRLVADDSLFKRTGRKVFGAGWHYDATATGRKRTAWGNNWVVVGMLVRLPFVPHRMVCLPVLARLWQPRRPGHSKLDLACELVGLICQRHPDRQVHLACDGAYAGKALRGLPEGVTVTTRLRADAALYQLPPPRRPGQRGRPRRKGPRLAELIAPVPASRTTTAEVLMHPDSATPVSPFLDRPGLELGPAPEPALHLLGSVWVASCPTCGYQLANARTQQRCEQRASRRTCPVCREEA